MATRETGLYWHCHHDRLWEYVYDAEMRRAYILENKPRAEQATRLERFQPVRTPPPALGQALAAYVQAIAACDQAIAAYAQAHASADAQARAAAYDDQARAAHAQARVALDQARVAYARARVAYARALAAADPEMVALHALECVDCPWDGQTLFPPEEE